MDWREFIASLVDSLAWPASAAAIVALLRRPIGGLLEAPVKRWKAGPVEVEYWEAAAEAAVAVAGAVEELPSTTATIETDADIERARLLAQKVPTVAVLKTFGLIERRLREIASASGGEAPEKITAPALAAGLRQQGLITAESESAIRGLATLRNLAAHDDGSGRALSVEKASEYVTLAQGVLYALSRRPSDSSRGG